MQKKKIKKKQKNICQKWDSNPRPQRGPEQLAPTFVQAREP